MDRFLRFRLVTKNGVAINLRVLLVSTGAVVFEAEGSTDRFHSDAGSSISIRNIARDAHPCRGSEKCQTSVFVAIAVIALDSSFRPVFKRNSPSLVIRTDVVQKVDLR